MKNNTLLRILLVKKLFLIFLFMGGMYNCTGTAAGSGRMPKEFGSVHGTADDGVDEIVLFCGNPGVGKSTLFNSIFGQTVFKSGFSCGTGMTTHAQKHIHEGIMYMDTPGLDDSRMREQAAAQIEEALKQNKSYKIVFVVKLDSGRIRGVDMTTINVVCDAIKTNFEYGLVFNQVPEKSIKKIEGSEKNQAMIAESLKLLHKKPTSVEVLTLNEDLVDEDNLFLDSRDANSVKLVQFIKNLKANKIEAKNVEKVDVTDYAKKLEEMEENFTKSMADLQKSMQADQESMRRTMQNAQENMQRTMQATIDSQNRQINDLRCTEPNNTSRPIIPWVIRMLLR